MAATLRARHVKTLVSCAADLRDLPPGPGALKQFLEILCRALGGEFSRCCHYDVPGRHAFAAVSERLCAHEVDPISAGMLEEHPILMHWHRKGVSAAVRLSDFVGRQSFARTRMHCEVLRPQSVNYQLGVPISAPGKGPFMSVGVDRATLDFTDEEVLLLELLRPHLREAFVRACLPEFTRDHFQDSFRWRGLTPREVEVLHWLAEGKSNADIGTILGASPRTVQKHVEHVFQKLGVETRTAAARAVLELVALPWAKQVPLGPPTIPRTRQG